MRRCAPRFVIAALLLLYACPGSWGQDEGAQKKALEHLVQARVKILEIEFAGTAKEFAPVREIATLRRVRLSGLRISKAHLELIADLKDLQSVDLWDTCAGDSGLECLGKMTQLREIRIAVGWSMTNKGLKHLGKLHNLESLDVSEVIEATDAWLTELEGLAKLRRLDLGRMSITDKGAEFISRLPAVKHLELYQTKITNKSLDYLKVMPRLQQLDVNDTKVTEAAVIAFQKDRPDVTVIIKGEVFVRGKPRP